MYHVHHVLNYRDYVSISLPDQHCYFLLYNFSAKYVQYTIHIVYYTVHTLGTKTPRLSVCFCVYVSVCGQFHGIYFRVLWISQS